MENLRKKEADNTHNILIERSNESELTKEIALALIEVKLMQKGKIRPLSLDDI